MRNLLLLVHRIPFPPDKGDKIRSFNLLRHLSKRYRVYLGGFVDNPGDWDYVREVEQYCSEVFFRPVGGWGSKLSAARAFIDRRSLSIAYFSDSTLRDWVDRLVDKVEIDVAVCFSSTMCQFLPKRIDGRFFVLADFVDLDSDKWRQYAAEAKWPISSVYSYEAGALEKWEIDVVQNVEAVSLVSSAEQRLLFDRAGRRLSNVHVVRNGVDFEFFDPGLAYDNPFGSGRPVALFTGAMDYFANVQGVKWFADLVWPHVRREVSGAEFWIVGSNPTRQVLALQSVEGVTVTGYVPDVRPYLKHATVAVAPLLLARGVQNKVLEALAMGCAVIATPQALQGLEPPLPESTISLSDPSEFAKAVVSSLKGGAVTDATGGRGYVERKYDWEKNLSELDSIFTGGPKQNGARRTDDVQGV